jgi:hypothetical protein
LLTGLAIATAGDVGMTTFGGLPVQADDVLVMFTYAGDANLSGTMDADDYFAIDSNYNKPPATLAFHKGDFNLDGVIDGDDYAIIDSAYSFAHPQPGAVAVPEPVMLGYFALLALRHRRRR